MNNQSILNPNQMTLTKVAKENQGLLNQMMHGKNSTNLTVPVSTATSVSNVPIIQHPNIQVNNIFQRNRKIMKHNTETKM